MIDDRFAFDRREMAEDDNTTSLSNSKAVGILTANDKKDLTRCES